MKKIELQKYIEDDDFNLICVCAERYAIGRQTYMPRVVQSYIKRNIEHIDDNSIQVMINDIESANSWPGGYGDEKIDKPGWLDFLEFLRNEKRNREESKNN